MLGCKRTCRSYTDRLSLLLSSARRILARLYLQHDVSPSSVVVRRSPLKSICVIADKAGSKYFALNRAIPLAKALGATIDYLAFVYEKGIEGADFLNERDKKKIKKDLIEKHRALLNTALKDATAEKVPWKLSVHWQKHVAPFVVDHCKKHDYLLLMKTGNRSESLFHTPTDHQLMRQSNVPVMIVAPRTWKKRPCVLAALDLRSNLRSKRQLNGEIMRVSTELAESLHMRVHCIHALEVPQALVDLDVLDGAAHAKKLREELAPQKEAIMQTYGIPEERIHLVRGPAGKVIPRVANKIKADMVVIGSIGRRGVKGALLGNTAEQVLSNLRTDILTLRP